MNLRKGKEVPLGVWWGQIYSIGIVYKIYFLPSGVSHLGLSFLEKCGIWGVVAPSAIPDNWKNIFEKIIFFNFFFYSSEKIFCSAMQKSLYQCKLKLPDFYKLTKNQISKCQLMSQWKSKRKFFTSMVNLKIFSMEIRQKFKVFRFSTMRFWYESIHRISAVWSIFIFWIDFLGILYEC